MSLNFATKNWKFELTLEALHIQPLSPSSNHSGDDTTPGNRREPQHNLHQKTRVADYFLSRILVPAPTSLRKQE
jgi:hypothetical protein